jgi:hypothetical protein
MGGVVAAVSTSATRFAPSSGRERKIPSGTSGCRTELSTITKPTRNTTEDPRATRVTGAVKPASCTLVIPYTSSVRPAVTLTAPATSRRGGAASSRLSEINTGASTTPRTPTGTLTKNTHSHPNPPVKSPPNTQPVAPPPAAAAVHTPSARPRPSPSGKVAVSEESAEGATIAAPNPCAMRPITSESGETASPQASEATENTASPTMNSLLLPQRSAARPASNRKPPKTSVYAEMTH